MTKIRIQDKNPYDFSIKETLHPDLWEDDALKQEVIEMLLKIADDFIEGLDIDGIEVEDIQFTGSLANFNWSSYSDIDLHLLIDFAKIDENEDLVRQYLNTKKNLWNNRHRILIKGFEVEIYPQDVAEEHHSTGVYSIMNEEWVIKPVRKEFSPSIDDIKKKVKDFINKSDVLNSVDKIKALRKRIRKMRKCGLEDKGEYSIENLAFKVLRRINFMKKLRDLEAKLYDKSLSISE